MFHFEIFFALLWILMAIDEMCATLITFRLNLCCNTERDCKLPALPHVSKFYQF